MDNTTFNNLLGLLRGKPLLDYGLHPANEFDYWRERILFTILAYGTALSLLALAPAVIMSLSEERWQLLVADLAALALACFLLFSRRLGLKVRSIIVLLIVFSVGVVIVMEVGFASGGPAWLFFFAVLAGVIVGPRGALAAAAMNAVALVVLAQLDAAGAPLWHGLNISLQRALVAWINFTVLNAASAVSVAVLVRGLQSLNTRTQQATDALEIERSELLKTKEDLKREIAVRIESEKALRKSESNYRLLAESIPDVIWSMDLNLRFTYVAPKAVSMQGWSREEHMNLGLEQIMTPASIAKVKAAFAEKYAQTLREGASGRPTTLELELLHKDGSTVWAEVTASFVMGEGNQPIGILGVTRDITERRKAAKERDLLVESLERSKKMEALGTLAGGVAHDLNNVLSGIVSYPDLLLLDLPHASPLRKPIETIRDSGKKAAAIVQDLLTLARRGVSTAEVLNLNDLICEHLASPEFRRLQSFHPLVDIKTRLDPDLSNIMGSSLHVSKTIMNLLSNAVEAIPKDGVITIATENVYLESPIRGYAEVAEGPYVRLRVSDSGIGIPAEDLQRIFEPFYTKKKMGRSGTGLGMTVVWGTVQDHHGYIDITSTQDEGSTVDVFLPATPQDTPLREAVSTLEDYTGRGEKILVVDDVEEQREILARILSHLGYDTVSAASGEEAVEYMAGNTADLVILDMIMDPGIDGLETYQRILKHHPHQKAVIISGFAETSRVKCAEALGAGAYVRKPYSVEELAKALRSELERPKPSVV